MKHRQEYNMRLNKLLKKYRKLCAKASKVHEQIMELYEDEYLKGDINACKQVLNSLYGTTAIYNEKAVYSYTDTDSLADGMKYTE